MPMVMSLGILLLNVAFLVLLAAILGLGVRCLWLYQKYLKAKIAQSKDDENEPKG